MISVFIQGRSKEENENVKKRPSVSSKSPVWPIYRHCGEIRRMLEWKRYKAIRSGDRFLLYRFWEVSDFVKKS